MGLRLREQPYQSNYAMTSTAILHAASAIVFGAVFSRY